MGALGFLGYWNFDTAFSVMGFDLVGVCYKYLA